MRAIESKFSKSVRGRGVTGEFDNGVSESTGHADGRYIRRISRGEAPGWSSRIVIENGEDE